MDPNSGASQSGPPKQPTTQTQVAPIVMLTWPIGVQIALGFLIIASVFFLLGRWSHAGWSAPPDALVGTEHADAGLDLNRATKAELRLLPGLGDALAQRVVDHRERHGPFRSVGDLRKVAGIGPKTLDRLRHHLLVAPEEAFVLDGESVSLSVASTARSSPRTAAVSKKATELAQPINVNRATQADLQKLPGIGPKLSQRILDERAKSAFKSIEDLRRVPGIGPKTLEKLRPHVAIQ